MEASHATASVEVLAADGSGWSMLTPMGTARTGPTAALLPCGKVVVAGGYWTAPGQRHHRSLKTAEMWDPATGAWVDLPPMSERRWLAGCCVLPSGRVAVVGGTARRGAATFEGEVFDPAARTWQPLTPMSFERSNHGAVEVAGGLLAVGIDGWAGPTPLGLDAPELFDEESGRWFTLPHSMAEPRIAARVASVPATPLTALATPPAIE